MSLEAENRDVYHLRKGGLAVSVPDPERGGQKTERLRVLSSGFFQFTTSRGQGFRQRRTTLHALTPSPSQVTTTARLRAARQGFRAEIARESGSLARSIELCDALIGIVLGQ
jgi:hypothetical protein